MKYRHRCALAAGLYLVLAAGGCKDGDAARTELVLSVSSRVPVDEVQLWARNIRYEQDSVPYPLGGRDITTQPLSLLFVASDKIGGELLVYAKGMQNNRPVAADARLFTYEKGKQISGELVLTESFLLNDQDGDGFQDCKLVKGSGCDCDDRNKNKNIFTEEECDNVENNCGGGVDEGCQCLLNALPRQCYSVSDQTLWIYGGIGACYLGLQKCIWDSALGQYRWEDCQSAGAPSSTEVPGNFIDDDCDGAVDEGDVCTTGTKRPCLLGFVDDPNNPAAQDPDPRYRDYGALAPWKQASRRAIGECRTGQQDCVNGTWSKSCIGESQPTTRIPNGVGWEERFWPVDDRSQWQCDGRDNDCDALYDEVQDFDADDDGYTGCGTACAPGEADPKCGADCALDPAHPSTEVHWDDRCIDCEDGDVAINPGARELCGNTVDEDCLCDHDPSDTPPATGSVIGQSRFKLEGTTRCDLADAYLDCGRSPRSDPTAPGVCEAAGYYYGFVGPTDTNKDCYWCREQYGHTCSTTGACAVPSEDCPQCDSPTPPLEALAEARDLCEMPSSGCQATQAAVWAAIEGTDPNSECGALGCDGYYCYLSGSQCFQKDDQPADKVSCKTAHECQTAADLCPGETACHPIVPPTCQQATSGCTGTTAPGYSNQNNGDDLFSQCGAGQACFGGVCLLKDGEDCKADNQCGHNQCECANAACSAKVCSAVRCTCGYNTNGDGVCEGFVSDGIDDAVNTCGTLSCNGQGVCNLDLKAPCDANYKCESNQCECTDFDSICSKRVCAAATCLCKYGADGACTTNLTNGTPDPEDCDQPGYACQNGNCRRVNGASCTVDADCGSNNCECTNADCTGSKVCSKDPCVCQYTAGGLGGCDGALTSGIQDPEDCVTAGYACYGGACLKDDNQPCGADNVCGHGQCECIDAGCSSRKCSAVNCACTFNGDGNNTCDGNITAGTQDPQDCTTANYACYGGACLKNNNQPCGADSECGYGQCECIDAGCSSRRCSNVNCACTYNSNGDGVCDGNITFGTQDPQDCITAGYACYNGACLQTCTLDNQCASNQCECLNASCTARACSTANCVCTYNQDGNGTCDGSLTNGTQDPQDCTAAGYACYGGACLKIDGETCFANSECGHGQCECTNSDCTTRACATTAMGSCTCGYGVGGACTWSLANGTKDWEDCEGAYSCYGGLCKLDNGQDCTAGGNAECGSNICDCANASCSTRVCSSANCVCGYDVTGDGACDGALSPGTKDPDDCNGTNACNGGTGASACKLDIGQGCTADNECARSNCECTNADCTARVCAGLSCACKYSVVGGCVTPITAGTPDPEDCDGTNACDGAGGCKLANGQPCTGNTQCGSGQCECIDATCSSRVCSAANCDCTYNANGDATCEGDMGYGEKDPEDCTGVGWWCNGFGTCCFAC